MEKSLGKRKGETYMPVSGTRNKFFTMAWRRALEREKGRPVCLCLAPGTNLSPGMDEEGRASSLQTVSYFYTKAHFPV